MNDHQADARERLLELFLDGELTDGEMESLRASLADDEGLRTLVREDLVLRSALEEAGEAAEVEEHGIRSVISNVLHFIYVSAIYLRILSSKSCSYFLSTEIYKIKEKKDEKLKKNILAKLNQNSKVFNLVGLKSNIWKRRRNLHGIVFNSVTEIVPPYVNKIKTSDGTYRIAAVKMEQQQTVQKIKFHFEQMIDKYQS